MPKISAVMALYDTPLGLLDATVKSILNQTFQDFELIVIDDASSIEFKDFFANLNDGRIKYHKLEKNAGPGHARNEGIKKALGDYIAIVDSDDIYLPERFEVQYNFFENNPEISLISCAFKFSNKNKISEVIAKDEEIKTALLFNSALSNPAVMFRKKPFAENNLFYAEDINFAEDYSLWIDAMFCGLKMANLKEVLMIYTRRKNQLSKSKAEEQSATLKNLYKKIFEKLGLEADNKEIELHFAINNEDFKSIQSKEIIGDWFNKIVEKNKIAKIFNEQKLIQKKESVVNNFSKQNTRCFKLKIAEYNLCLYKPFTIKFEKRN